MSRAWLAALLGACALAAGCGDDEGSGDSATTTVQRTTRVEVVRGAGGAGFDPQKVYEQASPGVVTVISTGLRALSDEDGEGLGSGFVVSGEGEIVTNAHVVTSGESQSIRRAEGVYVRFGDGNQVKARIVGFDPFSDVALLRVDPRGLKLRPLELGRINPVRVGEPVAAIGSPFGEDQSLSIGVVSAKDRSIRSLTGFDTNGAIQTDAAINSGNSGGPLLNAAGEVIGINSQIRTRSGDGSGVGFAVPVDVVRRSVVQLREQGRVRYAYLGVSTRGVYPQLARRFDLPVSEGAWIQEVVRNGPADDADLRAGGGSARFQESRYVTGGDIITRVGQYKLHRDADLGKYLVRFRPGEKVRMEVWRDGRKRELEVELGERPLQAPRG